jgi:hypothetical protein
VTSLVAHERHVYCSLFNTGQTSMLGPHEDRQSPRPTGATGTGVSGARTAYYIHLLIHEQILFFVDYKKKLS